MLGTDAFSQNPNTINEISELLSCLLGILPGFKFVIPRYRQNRKMCPLQAWLNYLGRLGIRRLYSYIIYTYYVIVSFVRHASPHQLFHMVSYFS